MTIALLVAGVKKSCVCNHSIFIQQIACISQPCFNVTWMFIVCKWSEHLVLNCICARFSRRYTQTQSLVLFRSYMHNCCFVPVFIALLVIICFLFIVWYKSTPPWATWWDTFILTPAPKRPALVPAKKD